MKQREAKGRDRDKVIKGSRNLVYNKMWNDQFKEHSMSDGRGVSECTDFIYPY